MRFALILVAVLALAVAALFVYGLTLHPEARTIEQDAVGAANG